MADRFCGTVRLGGTITEQQLKECDKLLDLLTEQQIAQDGETRFFECIEEDFSEFIVYCTKHGIAVNLVWEPKYEIGGKSEYWIDGKYKIFEVSSDGKILVSIDELKESEHTTIQDFITSMEIPDFPLFSVH